MMSDQILAGAEQNEISALESISSAYLEVPEDVVAMLHAKGWIDLVNGQMLLTLTGPHAFEPAARDPDRVRVLISVHRA